VFLEKRLKKVERFANFLDRIGMHESAHRLNTDPSVRLPEEFNPLKAWIEYINRLFGVLSGLFGLAWMVLVFANRSLRSYRFWVSIGFFFLLVNAWLGSLVVATNLIPGIVSLHYLLSFVCLFAMLYALHLGRKSFWVSPMESSADKVVPNRKKALLFWLISWLVVTLGTWSREQVEFLRVSDLLIDKETASLNISEMGIVFGVHRYLPALLLLVLIRWVYKQLRRGIVHFASPEFVLMIVALMQIMLGVIQVIYVLPVWSQVLHILLGSAFVTISFIWWISEHLKFKLNVKNHG
jgi:cytochrome c oxidase assembly protein subunit 15